VELIPEDDYAGYGRTLPHQTLAGSWAGARNSNSSLVPVNECKYSFLLLLVAS